MVDIYSKTHKTNPDNIINPIAPKELRKQKLDEAIAEAANGRKPDSTSNPLAAFCYYPKHVGFINKDPKEEVILMLRKHPLTNVRWILISLVIILIPITFPLFSFYVSLPSSYQLIVLLLWYLMTTAYVMESFLTWFFNVNIITDERIIDVDFYNLIFREITDANIDQIQDVTVQIGGGLRTFANFGSVLVQTAAEIPMIEFHDVPKPDQVASVLRAMRVEEETEKIEGRVR